MALAASILLGVCVRVAMEVHAFASTAVRATGTVIDLHQGQDTSHPEISFVDGDGHEHRFLTKVRSSPPAFYKGESVVVLYPVGSPTQARVDSFLENWFASLIAGTLGSLCLLASALMWAFRKRLFRQYSNPQSGQRKKS